MRARLEGGPHDGDHGELQLQEPPGELWTISCANRCQTPCPEGGVHWWWKRDGAEWDAGRLEAQVEHYLYDRMEALTWVYVYGKIAPPGGRSEAAWREDREPALA